MKHLILAAALLGAAAAAQAQPAAAPPLRVEGPTVDGKPFQLASLKGKVVLLMFWSTDCAVCRDKMAELRQNYQGWQGKPFELVLVSVDRRMKDVDDYEAVISRMVPLQQRFVQLWAGAAGTLPSSLLIDKGGKVVERWQGRIPAEAWDKIAELL
jgi:peroxiredoxin